MLPTNTSSYMSGIGGSKNSSGTFGSVGPVPGGYKPYRLLKADMIVLFYITFFIIPINISRLYSNLILIKNWA